MAAVDKATQKSLCNASSNFSRITDVKNLNAWICESTKGLFSTVGQEWKTLLVNAGGPYFPKLPAVPLVSLYPRITRGKTARIFCSFKFPLCTQYKY